MILRSARRFVAPLLALGVTGLMAQSLAVSDGKIVAVGPAP